MKEFYQINSIDTTKEDWEKEGFKVINFSQVKNEYLKVINTKEQAQRFQMFNPLTDSDPKLEKIHTTFNQIVFKESRGNSRKQVIGWENLNSYLRYHSGIEYKWIESHKAKMETA